MWQMSGLNSICTSVSSYVAYILCSSMLLPWCLTLYGSYHALVCLNVVCEWNVELFECVCSLTVHNQTL